MLCPLVTPWAKTTQSILDALESTTHGLTELQASQRLAEYGKNEIATGSETTAFHILLSQFKSPLVLILIGASLISFALGQRTETIIILVMTIASGLLAFAQEYRSERALHQLKQRLTRTATVIRDGQARRLDIRELVPGDIIEFDLGNVIPADIRLLSVEDLEVDEASLTGESEPVAKQTEVVAASKHLPQEQLNLVFSGTHIVQGSGRGIVIATGANTQLGKTAALLTQKTEETDFLKGIREFGSFILKVTLGLAFVVFVVLGILRGDWSEALLFALALAVGISPELLPVIVTINLSRGAFRMSQKHVLVKRLIAIEDLGNADVFCTDKTGTLTVGTLRVRDSIDIHGKSSPISLAHASQCVDIDARGIANNTVDQAIVDATSADHIQPGIIGKLCDMISFDFKRRRMSCVVRDDEDQNWMITKGAFQETLDACTHEADGDRSIPLTDTERKRLNTQANHYNDQGYRLVAVARRHIDERTKYAPTDEHDLELLGFVLVSDAPKETAKAALAALKQLHVRIIILTGDIEHVTRHVAEQLGFTITGMLTGDDLEQMSNEELQRCVESTNVFARITPEHKLRIIQAFKHANHTVGFMGDGVNDAPALRAADVGISFDDATDVAKEAASVILLKKNLSVLAEGIREGRRTFINTRTYIRCTISSNFGNMLSVAGAALLLPFIPLLPAQILLMNLLNDIPMLSISTDNVADADLMKPKKWNIHQISNFMYFFGSISSLADYVTFAILLFVVHADVATFRSSWFIESMLTQIVIISLLRSRQFTLKNLPNPLILLSSAFAILTGIAIVESDFGTTFGFVPIGQSMYLPIFGILIGYIILTELGKLTYFHYKENIIAAS